MVIGGLEKLTLIDYPGELAAIVFTQGCNFRCHFCYNPMLVWPVKEGKLKYKRDHSFFEENDLFDFLRSRIGKLSGVVITGGEPTLHQDLPEFLKKVKDLGYKIKLDSNGTNPEMLKRVLDLELVDYLAMDIKNSPARYDKAVNVGVNLDKLQESIKMIIESGLPHEFRTTVVPGIHTKEDFRGMGEMIRGADKWYLQFFKSDTELVDREFEGKDKFMIKDMEEMAEIGRGFVKLCEVRG